MSKYIDAHCHIGCGAADNSVAMFFCNAVNESQWADILRIAQNNSAVLPVLGIHPWCVDNVDKNWDAHLQDLLVQNPRAMVGEIGLDKMRPDYETQLDVFTRCLQIACDLGRTVNIHCVRAWNDMLRILKTYRDRLPTIIFHGFAASSDVMKQLEHLGNVYFSFGPAVCDVRHARLRATVYNTPISRILIESDGYMCNASNMIRGVAECVATIKNIPHDDLKQITYDNAIGIIRNG